ncbi:hypothetical protein ALC56_11530 [Trachymyrmex septentrionalis]|uniref:Uncharacterized protein n=1 Tax=Trachymyrmex septentrionalis TaxID=34720 RepID=A0A195F2M0_9HYME|nr:hypothetical protein ALC56_11530 [Trachymyrmex septentrionalis]
MKNAHPIVSATTSSPVGPDSTELGEPAEPIIRLKLQKPLHWEWELTTSADALPVIQLLDKDGRLLVETTGRTAQRARGSFREGLKTHEQYPVDESRSSSKSKEQTSSPSTSSASFVATPFQSNRNIDGFSSKFGTCNFAPRKSRSDTSLINKSNEDITKDYFKRVYELLKRRQDEMKKPANENHEFLDFDDSSSSNYIEEKKKSRRRRKDESPQDATFMNYKARLLFSRSRIEIQPRQKNTGQTYESPRKLLSSIVNSQKLYVNFETLGLKAWRALPLGFAKITKKSLAHSDPFTSFERLPCYYKEKIRRGCDLLTYRPL